MPVDGLSTPTRAPGTHQIKFDSAGKPLEGLTPGKYQLVIEAAREVGGRELLSLLISSISGIGSAQASV